MFDINNIISLAFNSIHSKNNWRCKNSFFHIQKALRYKFFYFQMGKDVLFNKCINSVFRMLKTKILCC